MGVSIRVDDLDDTSPFPYGTPSDFLIDLLTGRLKANDVTNCFGLLYVFVCRHANISIMTASQNLVQSKILIL